MRTFFMLTVLIAIVSAPVFAGDSAAGVQKTLQADYDARDRAVARHDIEATLSKYAADFVGVSQTGKAHDLKEERLDFLKTFSLPAQSNVTQSIIQKLTLARGGLEADVTLHRHGDIHFADPQTHTDSEVVLDGIYLDVWTKHSRTWLLTREQAVSVKATMNGKPL